MNKLYSLAIVGGGPRGLVSLENFCIEMSKVDPKPSFSILLFEATTQIGNGPVYNTSQTASNWINISERALELEARKAFDLKSITIPSFPSYHSWANVDYSEINKDRPDQFPPRSTVGAYLSQRFKSIADVLVDAELLTVINDQVNKIDLVNNELTLSTQKNGNYKSQQAVLTIGHQPTKISKQIEKWKDFADKKDNVLLFENPYPIQNFIDADLINEKSVVGIRGFGLAMIDVARGIIEENGGKFIVQNEKTGSLKYESSDHTPKRFVPFSLDGLPMSPKPLNATIDDWYLPSKEQLKSFEEKISNRETQSNATDHSFLLNAITSITATIFNEIKNTIKHKLTKSELHEIILKWLKDDSFKHPIITPIDQRPEKTMKDFAGMAYGHGPISLDFCIGQVWRHCQPTIYKSLSYHHCSDEVAAKLIGIDERMKRYAYGPPAESIQQLLALIDAGVMTLSIVDDPDIEMVEDGWRFRNNGETITANIMINSVLDSPQLLSVNSPIIQNLLDDNLVKPVHSDLGVQTDENGYLISENGNKPLPIALLGRLAKGTVIGVDAILECFGRRPENWAKRAVKF